MPTADIALALLMGAMLFCVGLLVTVPYIAQLTRLIIPRSTAHPFIHHSLSLGTLADKSLCVTTRYQPKPAWVQREVIRLKALMPQAGCRLIAHTFNRCFEASRQMH